MENLPKIIDALNSLRNELGEDVDKYLNYDAFLRKRDLVEHCRHSVENHIGRNYLPGFRFASTDHARWHFRNRDFLPFWVMDFQSNEEHWVRNWIRAAFVPSYKHYCYEVATALKRYDDNTIRTVRDFKELIEKGDKKAINRATSIMKICRSGKNLPPGPVKIPNELMGIDPWTTRIAKLFTEDILPTTSRSLRRWPEQAVSRREARKNTKPFSGWYIDYLCYFGEIPCPEGHDPEKWGEMFHDYYENWKWAPVPGIPDPQRTSMSFKSLVSPDLWNASEKKVRYKYDDS